MMAVSSLGKITSTSENSNLSSSQSPSSVIFLYCCGVMFIAPCGPVTRHSSAIMVIALSASLSTIDCQKSFSSRSIVALLGIVASFRQGNELRRVRVPSDQPIHLSLRREMLICAAMAIREILEVPDPRLKTVSAPVESFDEGLKALVADMFETMYAARGIGLAAIQVGVPQ